MSIRTKPISKESSSSDSKANIYYREDDVEGSLKLILDELKDRIDKQEGR